MTPRELASYRRLVQSMKAKSDRGKGDALADFQKLVRLQAADSNGICTCITCGRRKHWKEMNGGHFIGGRRNAICFDPKNVHAQCVQCNMHYSGRPAEYLRFMIDNYGMETVESLKARDRSIVTMTAEDYAELCIGYRRLIKREQERLGER